MKRFVNLHNYNERHFEWSSISSVKYLSPRVWLTQQLDWNILCFVLPFYINTSCFYELCNGDHFGSVITSSIGIYTWFSVLHKLHYPNTDFISWNCLRYETLNKTVLVRDFERCTNCGVTNIPPSGENCALAPTNSEYGFSTEGHWLV